jgi:hypothetical protein
MEREKIQPVSVPPLQKSLVSAPESALRVTSGPGGEREPCRRERCTRLAKCPERRRAQHPVCEQLNTSRARSASDGLHGVAHVPDRVEVPAQERLRLRLDLPHPLRGRTTERPRLRCLPRYARIHQVAYVRNRVPAKGSNFSTARIKPRLPSCARSSRRSPA